MYLNPKTRQQINMILCAIVYRPTLPIGEIVGILNDFGLIAIEWEGAIFCGHTATLREPLVDVLGESVENAMLIFYWYKMSPNRYEINAYIS